MLEGQGPFFGTIHNARVFHIADDDGNARRDGSSGTGIGDGGAIGTFPGAKDAQANESRFAHRLFLDEPGRFGNDFRSVNRAC